MSVWMFFALATLAVLVGAGWLCFYLRQFLRAIDERQS